MLGFVEEVAAVGVEVEEVDFLEDLEMVMCELAFFLR